MSLRNLSLKEIYRSDRDDIISEFFVPCLANCIEYSRCVERISAKSLTTIILAIGDDPDTRVRIVSGHRFGAGDIALMNKIFSKDGNRIVNDFIRDTKINRLRQAVNGNHLAVKVAVPNDEEISGIFTERVGIFTDIWEWEKFAQNDGTVSEYTADKSVYASDADAEKSATISVTGTATASVDPDIFTVRLGVSTQDKNAGMALSSNSKTMENVIAGVMGAGINKDEISTSSLKVYPVYGDYDYDKNESPIVGFRAENIILIETTKLDSATSIIDGASEAGANRIDGLRFTLSSELRKEMENLLLQDAVLDAKNRANEALKPLGNSVSDVKTVNLSPIRYGGYDMQYSAKAESFSSVPIFSSSEDVTASVHVVFTIQ